MSSIVEVYLEASKDTPDSPPNPKRLRRSLHITKQDSGIQIVVMHLERAYALAENFKW